MTLSMPTGDFMLNVFVDTLKEQAAFEKKIKISRGQCAIGDPLPPTPPR